MIIRKNYQIEEEFSFHQVVFLIDNQKKEVSKIVIFVL